MAMLASALLVQFDLWKAAPTMPSALLPTRCGACVHSVDMHADAPQTKEEELPPWIRSERERKMQTEEGSDLPFPVYLIGSALVTIAAVRLLSAAAAC